MTDEENNLGNNLEDIKAKGKFTRQSLSKGSEDNDDAEEKEGNDEVLTSNESNDIPSDMKQMVDSSRLLTPAAAKAITDVGTLIRPRTALGSPRQINILETWNEASADTQLEPGQWVRVVQTFSKPLNRETISSVFSMFRNIREESNVRFLDITKDKLILEFQVSKDVRGTKEMGDISRNLNTITEEIFNSVESDVSISTQTMLIGLNESMLMNIAIAGAGIVGFSIVGAVLAR